MKDLQLLTPDNWSRSDPCEILTTEGESLQLLSRKIKADVDCDLRTADVTETFRFLYPDCILAKFIFPTPLMSEVYSIKVIGGCETHARELRPKSEAASLVLDLEHPEDTDSPPLVPPKRLSFSMTRTDCQSHSCEGYIVEVSYLQGLPSTAANPGGDRCLEFNHCASWKPGDSESHYLSYNLSLRSAKGFATVECPNSGFVLTFPSPTERYASLDVQGTDPVTSFAVLMELND